MTNQQKEIVQYALVAKILIIGAIWWLLSGLAADPPMYYSGTKQSLSTDPYMYTWHSRNEALFGDPNPLGDNRWVVFEKSLISYASSLWLKDDAPHLRVESNQVAVAISIISFLLFALAFYRKERAWAAIVFVFWLVTNVTLFTYGRLPFLEIGLLLFTALLFLIYSRWRGSMAGLIGCGVVIALAITMGKIYGALLLPGLLLTIWLQDSETKWKDILIVTGSTVLATFVLLLILYRGDLSVAFGFFGEQSYDLHGFPDGLKSPWAFVEHLISFGFEAGLYMLGPDHLLYAVIGGFMIVYFLAQKGTSFAELPPIVQLALCGFIVITFGLMPLNYAPHRYTIFMMPMLAMLFLGMLFFLHQRGKTEPIRLGKLHLTALVLLIWLLLFHLSMITIYRVVETLTIRATVWTTLPLALALTWLIKSRWEGKKMRLTPVRLKTIGYTVMTIAVLYNGAKIVESHYLEQNYNIEETNTDLTKIINRGAVFSGPYASTLTVNTEFKSVIHFFGSDIGRVELFKDFPVTHLLMDVTNWDEAIKQYPQLKNARPLQRYWIRDQEVLLYNVSRMFGNRQAMKYQPTPLERGYEFYWAEQYDSAMIEIQKMPNYQQSKAGAMLYISILFRTGQYDDIIRTFVALADLYPTDFFIQKKCGEFLETIGKQRRDQALIKRAETYAERSAKVNPFRASSIRHRPF